jgi:hypothetical protein
MTFAVIPHSPSANAAAGGNRGNSINWADQVGSLLRPSNVLDARDASKTGKIGREVLEREEDVGVLEVLMRQQQIDLLELRA